MVNYKECILEKKNKKQKKKKQKADKMCKVQSAITLIPIPNIC